MEDVVLHNVFRCLFLENIISDWHLCGAYQSLWIRMVSLVDMYLSFFERKKSSLGTTKKLFGCSEGNISFVNDQPSKHMKNKASKCYYFLHISQLKIIFFTNRWQYNQEILHYIHGKRSYFPYHICNEDVDERGNVIMITTVNHICNPW